MRLNELFESTTNILTEGAQLIWSKKGRTQVVRKFVCTSGPKKGMRVVDRLTCGRPKKLKKKMVMKRTLTAKGARMRRIAKRTKLYNPAAKRAAAMNKTLRGG